MLTRLHIWIIRPIAALRRCPVDVLARVFDIAGLAVNAVFVVNEKLLLPGVVGIVDHFVDRGGAELLARVAVVGGALIRADVRVCDLQVLGLIRFVLGAAVPAGIEGYERVIYMFDGHDEDAVSVVRERWKIEKKAGHDLTYWQQDGEGRWQKSA